MNTVHVVDSLRDLGFTEDCIVETIMVTTMEDGGPNPAPMGLTLREGRLTVKTYKTSQTYTNLLRGGLVYINLSNDPLLYLKTAFKDEISDQPEVRNFSIEGSNALIIAKVDELQVEKELHTTFSLTPINVKFLRPSPIVFNRGQAAAIDAVIHATRIQVFQEDGRFDDVQRLVGLVKDNMVTVEKVSNQKSSEYEVMNSIVTMIKKWGVKW